MFLPAVLLLAGCGGQAPSEPLDPAFLARANAVCKPTQDFDNAHHFPLKSSFDPDHPSASDLATLGKYLASNTTFAGVPDGLTALGKPSSHAADWDRFVALAYEEVHISGEQRDAALAGDAASFVAAVKRQGPLAGSIDTLVHGLGFGTKDACGQVFG